jgi:hypothetical protein
MTQCAKAATGITICCFAWGSGSEIQIKSFNEFKRQKELSGRVVGRCVVFKHKEGSPQIKGGGDDAIVILGVARSGMFRVGHCKRLK